MKKKLIIALGSIIISLLVMINVNAANIGDIVGQTLCTDIIASINDYNIVSYNIDGYTVIVAEDLRDFGFNVEWKPKERALYITRNKKTNKISSTFVAPVISIGKYGKY